MSISHRTHRAAIYTQTDTGTAGVAVKTWTRQNSTATDKLWWCARSLPTGRELTVGMKPEHRVDAVFSFSAAVTALTTDSLIVEDGVQYAVRAVLPRDHGHDEIKALCERSQETFPLTNPA